MYGQKSSLEAAVAVAAKLDADLLSKGKLSKVVVPLPEGLSKTGDLKLFTTEYKINDVPQYVRNLLCKGSTQEAVKKFSGASVSTRGRYISEQEKKALSHLENSSDKPVGLYLFIQGPTKQSVDLAVQKIEELIMSRVDQTNNRNMPPPLMSLPTQIPPPNVQNTPPPGSNLHEKVPVGLENVLAGFNLSMKLIGQNGSNLHYIRNETGAIVTLRGMGSAFVEPSTGQEAQEPLHFLIEHTKPDVIGAARDLALNLIATVQQEYAQFLAQQPPPQIQHATQAPPPMQQINVQPGLVLQGHADQQQQLMQQGVVATSISLPVVQTGFIQQPALTQLTVPPPIIGVPPPHMSQPPPNQVALPPPGLHIPPQQGPLVPTQPQPIQIHPQGEPGGNLVQQIQPGQPGQPQPQQQYVITNNQPMQGIMTSQGLVVLNQQPQPQYTQQQVYLSQPPQHVLPPGSISFQQAAPGQQYQTVQAPVSYQLQYVQQNPPPVTYSPLQTQQSQIQIQSPGTPGTPNNQQNPNQPTNGQNQRHSPNSTQQTVVPCSQVVVHQTPTSVQSQAMLQTQTHTFVGHPQFSIVQGPVQKPPEQNQLQLQQQTQNYATVGQFQQHFVNQQGQIFQQQNQQFLVKQQQPYYPQQQIQYATPPPAPGQFQMGQRPPGSLSYSPEQNPGAPDQKKRKFTDEANPDQSQSQSSPQSLMSVNAPQPVPHPSQTLLPQVARGIGSQDMMAQQQQQRIGQEDQHKGAGEDMPPPPPPTANSQPGSVQNELSSGNQNPDSEAKAAEQQQQAIRDQQARENRTFRRENGNEADSPSYYSRRDKPRDRPSFNHYSNKPMMYDNNVYQNRFMPAGLCPPPPPPPSQAMGQGPQQHHYPYYQTQQRPYWIPPQ